jgi:hypothetical protein
MQLYGSDRYTQDLDLIANHLPWLPSSRKVEGQLTFGGVSVLADNGVPVDIILRNDQYEELYVNALVAARPIKGVPIPGVTLPDRAAMKLAAGRAKDLSDLEFILCDANNAALAQGTTVTSFEMIKTVVKAHLGVYAAEELSSIRELALWERQRKGSKKS